VRHVASFNPKETAMNPDITSSSSKSHSSAFGIAATIALVLLIVGGLNWALVGLFEFDLVATLFGTMTIITRTVYVLVGLAAVYALTLLPKMSR
jgi:uncharacterized membrane protein YuzA (DUF378 family)